ncbi:MAG: S8 family serine peptidase [Pyrinomonadaceae bacterium]
MNFLKALVFSILFISLADYALAQKPSGQFVPDELLVKFRKDAQRKAALKAHSLIGAKVLEDLGGSGLQRIKLPASAHVAEILKRYEEFPEVEFVQPNYYYHLLNTPNDAQYPNAGMYGLRKISAPQAWDLTTGSSAVVVANIDTGVRYTHEDLAANMWTNPGETAGNGIDDDGNGFIDDIYGYDFFFNDSDPNDENRHGTHTAGTIGAVGNNSIGVVGVNWNVKIMAIKIYDSDGFGTTSAMLINAYNYVRLMKERGVNIRVTNNSYGGCSEACGYDQATKDAIDALGNAGILNVFAAGNDNRNTDTLPAYPASYTSPSILSVAASSSTDTRPVFSNFGVLSVDLAAPGLGILSTINASNSSYDLLNGTSMATPHAAGAAALLSAYNPNLSAASLKATLMNTVDVLPNWNGVVKTGGRLNVSNALLNQTVCSLNTPNSSITVPTKGGTFSVNITAPQNCDYSVRSPVKWIKISGPDSLSGNGTFTFRVTVNPTITRSATIDIGGQTYTVNQSRNGIL